MTYLEWGDVVKSVPTGIGVELVEIQSALWVSLGQIGSVLVKFGQFRSDSLIGW